MAIPVVEIFNSIEGEGIRSGRLCTFVRVAGCNLRCSYCDTAYSFDVKQATQMTVDQIYKQIEDLGCQLVTLTGGEPLLYEELYNDLLVRLLDDGYLVNIETNGAVDISKVNRRPGLMFTVDYTCPSSGMEDKMLLSNLANVYANDVLKFVVGSKNDLIAMNKVLKDNKIRAYIYISPVFGQIELQEIVEFMKDNKLFKATLQVQLHKIIWDPQERGV